MAIPPPDPNWSGAQKTAYTQKYGGSFSGSRYVPSSGGTQALSGAPPTQATTSGGPAPVGNIYQQYNQPATQPTQSQGGDTNLWGGGGASWAQAWPTQQPQQPQQGYPISAPPRYAPQGQYSLTGQAGPTGGYNNAQALAQAYQQHLGRAASPQEIQQRLADPGFNLQRHLQSIQQSQEAQGYAAQRQQQPPQMSGGYGYDAATQRGIDISNRIAQGPWDYRQGTVMQPPSQQGGADPRYAQSVAAQGQWDTDGYSRPAYIAQNFSSHPPAGFERAKWNNPAHQTPKYVVGRILSQFQPRTDNMDAVVAEIAKAYPGTRRTGSGDITIPGVGSADILKAADVGGKAWHFGGGGKSGGKPAQPQGGYDDPLALMAQMMAQQGMMAQGGYGQPMYQQPVQQGPDPQLLALLQQMQTMFAEQQAGQNAQRRTMPQFNF